VAAAPVAGIQVVAVAAAIPAVAAIRAVAAAIRAVAAAAIITETTSDFTHGPEELRGRGM